MSKSQPLIDISRKRALIFAFFLVMYEFLTYVSNDMIMPGMIKVVESFNGSESAIARSLMLYILGGSTLQIFLGPLSDDYGRRPIMIAGAWIFLVFTILIACSASMNQFLAARFFQGMGLCFITVVGYATLQEIFEEMAVVRLMALMANVAILAPLIGPLVGAVFVSYFDWRYIFVVIAILTILNLWGLWRFMPESVGQKKRDGTVIPHAKFILPQVISRYKSLFYNPRFMLSSIAGGLMGLPCVAWIALAPVIIVNESKASLIIYGLWQLPVFLSAILGNLVLRKLTEIFQLKALILIGSGILFLGLAIMPIGLVIYEGHFTAMMPGLIIYFFGLGISGSPIARFTLFSTDVTKGTASALMGLLLMCLQAFGIELINSIYASHQDMDFALYCAGVGILYILFIFLSFKTKSTEGKTHLAN